MVQVAAARQQTSKGSKEERWVAKRTSIFLEIGGHCGCLEVKGERFSM
jgi:hypothetical protein